MHVLGTRDLGLPLGHILSVDLGAHRPFLGALQGGGAKDVFGAQGGLVVVDVGGARRAEVAVNRVA